METSVENTKIERSEDREAVKRERDEGQMERSESEHK